MMTSFGIRNSRNCDEGDDAMKGIAKDGNIVLIGMPGVGKSSTGVVLAKMLNYDFVDTDILIQKAYDETLQEMIDSIGADEFIEREGSILEDLVYVRTIVATGGSAVYSHRAMEKMAKKDLIVYLRVGLEELRHRLPGFDDRGVVMRDPSTATLDALYAERVPLYEKYADIVVDTDGLSVSQVAFAIKDSVLV